MTAQRQQLRLALVRAPSLAPEDFLESPANAEALAAVRAWRTWPDGALALIGPAGSGKSHLARLWAEETGAVRVEPGQGIGAVDADAVVIEDVDRRTLRGEPLFHLFNAAVSGARLLLTARTAPRNWPVDVPDLRSRVNALVVAELHPPDDRLLRGVLTMFFRDRHIRVDDDVLTYLLRRIERSIPAAAEVVRAIDETAAANRREITRALASEVLDRLSLGPDLFDKPCREPPGRSQQGGRRPPDEPSDDR